MSWYNPASWGGEIKGAAGDVWDSGKGLYDSVTGSLGFKSPDSSSLKDDKAGYESIKGSAGELNTATNTPTADAPTWFRPTMATSGITLGTLAQSNAAQATPTFIDYNQANASRAQQQGLISQLQLQAAGRGPSVAQEQLRQATDTNIAQQQAAAKSVHGNARLAALRQATWQGAATQQQASSQAAALRAQEIASTQGALSNLLTSQRAQDAAAAIQQAALQQQTNLANAGFGQQTNLTNAQLLQNSGQFDANAMNSGQQFNVNQYNQAGLNYAQQVNSGNQALSLADLNSRIHTNQLNSQRQQAYINALLQSQNGIAGLDSTIYAGNAAYDASKRNMVGNLINKAGGALASGGIGGEVLDDEPAKL